MAELLIKAVDYVPDDPALESGAFKRGDLVCVCEDGHPWGSEELNTEKFYIVRFPGEPVEAFARYLEPEYAEAAPEPVRPMMTGMGIMSTAAVDSEPAPMAPASAPEMLRVRAWHATGTPDWLQAALDAGPVEAEWEELKQYVRRKADGATTDEA